MTDEYETFVPGTVVTWREQETKEDIEMLEKWRREYGNGPFRILHVSECTDEARLKHPQTVHVCFDEAKRLVLPFSGSWFKHIRH